LPPEAPERPCDTTGEAGRVSPLPPAACRVHALCSGVARAVRILIRLIQPFENKLMAVEDSLDY
jgi:hypothetical protein